MFSTKCLCIITCTEILSMVTGYSWRDFKRRMSCIGSQEREKIRSYGEQQSRDLERKSFQRSSLERDPIDHRKNLPSASGNNGRDPSVMPGSHDRERARHLSRTDQRHSNKAWCPPEEVQDQRVVVAATKKRRMSMVTDQRGFKQEKINKLRH